MHIFIVEEIKVICAISKLFSSNNIKNSLKREEEEKNNGVSPDFIKFTSVSIKYF